MPGPTDSRAVAVEEARRQYRLRRLRDQEFGAALFGEPAWDLLLDLYVASSDPGLVSILSASIESCVSTQDTARCLSLLEEHGLVERLHPSTGISRPIVTLTQNGFDRMTRLFSERP